MQSKTLSFLALLVGAAFFISSVYFGGAALRHWRIDNTEDRLYTLAQGTRNILGRINEPIVLRLFYSRELAPEVGIEDFGRRVEELLAEFEDAADGNIVLQIIDPEPYSKEEELAASLGIRGTMLNAKGDLLFFGLAATNSVDEVATIGDLDPSQESFLEYELAKLIIKLSVAEPPKVAVFSSLPLQGGQGANPFGPPEPAWRIVAELAQTFEVEFLPAERTEPLDALEFDAVLVVHPKGMPETTRYAIDQYALAGGKVCVLVDPHCVFELPPPQARPPIDASSELPELLHAWGVDVEPGVVVGDLKLGHLIPFRNQALPFPLWTDLNTGVDAGVLAEDDVVTSSMRLVSMLAPGSLRVAEEATTTFTPLIRTTPGGRGMDVEQLQRSPESIIALAPTLVAQFLEHAEGTIEFSGVPEEGASITLSDGVRAPVTFEFSTDPEVAEGNEVVLLQPNATAADVAQALRIQILIKGLTVTDTDGLDLEAAHSGAKVLLTTREAGPHGEVEIRQFGDLSAAVDGMAIRGLRRNLAARVRGPIKTSFPGGAPERWEGDDEHLGESTTDFNGIVIADVDFLHDNLCWRGASPLNDNPSVLINALENLCGSNDLLSLRSRGIERRLFTKKEELDQEARKRFQAKGDDLAKKQQKLEGEIRELMQGADESGVVYTSSQQIQKINDKTQELAETRSALGRVKGDLKREIDDLGDTLFLRNLLLPPGLVLLLGMLYGLHCVTRRKAK
ncbi:MAG: GldG family protein [Planctomycetota bacterium]|nr:GldG family protein [Planctomycetota bacterium]